MPMHREDTEKTWRESYFCCRFMEHLQTLDIINKPVKNFSHEQFQNW